MLLRKLLQTTLLSLLAVQDASARALAGKPHQFIRAYEGGKPLQDIVTWDEHSLLIRGERVMLYSGEFHPFRIPVPSLWLDVFQKIKSLGYNCVSFYTHWALHEGKPGEFSAEGIFGYEKFFDAAAEAGIYLIARPGPYINAEVSGGGFPGWLQRVPGTLRTKDQSYLDATENYMKNMGEIIAKAQITNGGPVILVQPENEYTSFTEDEEPDQGYFIYVEEQLRRAGIVVPLINNEASAKGYVTPKTKAEIDIYGFDGYPLGFDCANPQTWPDDALPTDYADSHEAYGAQTPFSILEFQGGSFDPWGGWGFAQCQELVNYEFQRVFYKNNFAQGVTILNLYMTYGGTNWGNLGHPGGYTSYDYAAVISEERLVDREKYSEAKLEANFLQASPAFLTADYQNTTHTNGSYTGNPDLAVTALFGNTTKFFVIRHAAFNSLDNTEYSITLPTSQGNISIPQMDGKLSLNGRDSKFHVTDYDLGGVNLLYSTAEIFTWKKYGDKRVLVVYGGPNEEHELAISDAGKADVVEGDGVETGKKGSATVLHYKTGSERKVVKLENGVYVYLLDRNSAYDYWVVDLPSDDTFGNYTNPSHFSSAPIVKTDYLLRAAKVSADRIDLTGDLNATSSIEVIGSLDKVKKLTFNGVDLPFERSSDGCGSIKAEAKFEKPDFTVPDLSQAEWKVLDTLPEIKESYDDASWTVADHSTTNNTVYNLTTPTSLSASDYGYHTGILLYRGHFTSNGDESSVYISTYGGAAYGHSIWINNTYVGSFTGEDVLPTYNQTYDLPKNLTSGANYVITVVVDNNSLNENYIIGEDQMKLPRGLIDYDLSGHDKSDVTWKLTGNLGGEDYADHARGPLNEGGLYAERAGFHLPDAPTSDWKSSPGPHEGLSAPGIAFYSTTFDLDLPAGYDIPLAFSFSNATSNSSSQQDATYTFSNGTARPAAYRCQLFVNGYQFGKYVHNVGPQDVYPVPEGIWNYRGSNTVAISLWAQEEDGAKVDGLSLVAGPVVQSGFGEIEAAPQPGWKEREGVY